MPQAEPFKLISDIVSLKPESKILIFRTHDDDLYGHQFLKLEAIGYLKKAAPQNEIKNAIDNCLHNKKYLSSSFIQVLNNGYNKNSDPVAFIAV